MKIPSAAHRAWALVLSTSALLIIGGFALDWHLGCALLVFTGTLIGRALECSDDHDLGSGQ